MLTVEMLPAEHGDCLWIEYGDPGRPSVLLIDGGTGAAATTGRLGQRIADRLGHDHPAALVVVTHVDADHITGVLDLLEAPGGGPPFAEVWFNGWEHLAPGVRGPVQGERLGDAIRRRRLPWNASFDGRAVVVPEDGPLPVVDLPGDLRLTLLSPSPTQLAELQPVWEREVREAGLVPGAAPPPPAPAAPDVLGEGPLDPETLAARRFSGDPSEANGSSIAFLAEHEGASVLFTGDAFAGVLAQGLRRLAAERGTRRLSVDAFKVSHHGSRNNLSPELLEVLDCPRFLFSTNGRRYRHPDAVAVSRIVVGVSGAELLFNYRTRYTEPWEEPQLRRRFGYRTRYPADGASGLTLQL
jgi:hypothetical protein